MRCDPGQDKQGLGIPAAILGMAFGGRGGRGGRGWGGWGGGEGGEGGAWTGGWARDARRRRMFDSGELRLVLLKLIADQPRHGYDLIRAIEELTGGEYAPSPGVVYPTLTLLQDMGLIEEAAGERPRAPFQITEAGRAYLEENAQESEELIARLKDLKPRPYPEGGSPV